MCLSLLACRNHIPGHRLFQQSGRVALPPTPQSRPAPSFKPRFGGAFSLICPQFYCALGGTLLCFLHFRLRDFPQKHPNYKAMNILDEYRRNAQECQRMAENAGNAVDKASWLRLAASWLGMIKNEPKRFFASGSHNGHGEDDPGRAWPKPSDEDSKASH